MVPLVVAAANLTVSKFFSLWLSTIDTEELFQAVRDVAEPGDNRADTQHLIRVLLDDAIPEELAGAKAVAVMEPIYEKAAERLTEFLFRRFSKPRQRPARTKRNQAELDRVAALIAQNTPTEADVAVVEPAE